MKPDHRQWPQRIDQVGEVKKGNITTASLRLKNKKKHETEKNRYVLLPAGTKRDRCSTLLRDALKRTASIPNDELLQVHDVAPSNVKSQQWLCFEEVLPRKKLPLNYGTHCYF